MERKRISYASIWTLKSEYDPREYRCTHSQAEEGLELEGLVSINGKHQMEVEPTENVLLCIEVGAKQSKAVPYIFHKGPTAGKYCRMAI